MKDDVIAQLEEEHRKELKLTVRELLRGIPREGGLFNRAVLGRMIESAFIGGVIVAREAKLKQSKN